MVDPRRAVAAQQKHLSLAERNAANGARYRKKNKERVLSGKRDRQREYTLIHRFNMSLDEYNTLLVLQNGACAICHHVPDIGASRYRKGKRLAVDHDHKTMKNRGLLCDKCNRGLGHFNDDPILLQKSIDYLNRYVA